MIIDNTQIDRDKLLSKSDTLGILRGYGEDSRALSRVCDYYFKIFGNELIWRYPISDGKHLGTHIVIVKEGFLSLPYDTVDREDGELLELSDAAMFDVDAMRFFIEDWRSFSDDLLNAMTDMLRILRGE